MPRIDAILIVVSLACALCCSLVSTADAQQKKAKPQPPQLARPQLARPPRGQRPQNRPLLKVQKLSPEMDQLLIDWENKTELIKKMSANVETFETNKVFNTKMLGVGEVKFEAPDKVSYRIVPKQPKVKQEGKFALKPADEERFMSTGKVFYQIDDKGKTYQKVPIPPEMQGKRIIDGPLPFLFGMKAAEAKRRFLFFPLKPTWKIKDSVWIKVIPRRQSDQQNYKEARVILDKTTFVPIAVMTTGLTGAEKVYTFSNIKINPRKMFWQGAFIKPDVRGYKQILDSVGAEKPGRVKIGGENPPRKTPREVSGEARSVRRTGYRSRKPAP